MLKQDKKNLTGKMEVTLVHDYLRTYGGGERVLEVLLELWPSSRIVVATADYKRLGRFGSRFKKLKIKTSWAQKVKWFVKKPILYRFLLPLVWSKTKIDKADLVISSSGDNIAKGVAIPESAFHICYCHTPPRYLYDLATEWNFLNKYVIKFMLFPLYLFLKYYDKKSSDNVDLFIVNSENVKTRIRTFYGRDSVVIYPPCKVPTKLRFTKDKGFFLVVSRLVSYKNIDLIVEAINKMGENLHIIGTGNDMNRLKKISGKSIEFLGEVPDEELNKNYQQCRALIVAAKDEDFGISAVEAMGWGKPVIALFSGGYKEIVIENKTGIFFREQNANSLMGAIKKFNTMKFDPKVCFERAQTFSEDNFKAKIKMLIDSILSGKSIKEAEERILRA